MEFEGHYGMENVIASGGGSYVTEDGVISLYGNVWKSFKLPAPYEASGNTHMDIKFDLRSEAEGHAICAEDDLDADAYGGFHRRCIALAGTQFDQWDDNHVLKIDKTESGTIMTKSVFIGNLFPEVGTKIKYISFVQDNDAMPAHGSSKFWDIKLYEIEPVSLLILFFSQTFYPDIFEV